MYLQPSAPRTSHVPSATSSQDLMEAERMRSGTVAAAASGEISRAAGSGSGLAAAASGASSP